MKSSIRIIKRNSNEVIKKQTIDLSSVDNKSPAAISREMAVTVKRWIEELQLRKRTQITSFVPLPVGGMGRK